MALVDEGEIEQAIERYQAAIRLDPSYAFAHNNLGAAYNQALDKEAALEAFDAALAADPNFALAHSNRASALAEDGKLEEALASAREAIRLDATVPSYHHNLGLILTKLGRPEEAVAAYEEALQRDPGYATAMMSLANAYHGLGRTTDAIASYRRLVALAPNDPVSLNNLGYLLLKKSDRTAADGEEAAVYLERACALTRREVAVMLDHLSIAYAVAGDYAAAVKTAEEALARARTGTDAETTAEVEQHLERFRQLRDGAAPNTQPG
jgi:tetratricopeptide (TPR) repeat protein